MYYDVHIHEGGGAMKEKPVYKSQCYCMNLRRAANAVTDYYDAVLKDLGVSVSQFSLLLNLARMETANKHACAESEAAFGTRTDSGFCQRRCAEP